MPDDYDLQIVPVAAMQAVSGRRGWMVTTDVVLALFSFQKFVMYKDLEANAPAVAAHRLVRQLVGREGDRVIGLPDDVRRLELDREFAPEATTQVVDADSSQLRAIAGVARGYDLVLEGRRARASPRRSRTSSRRRSAREVGAVRGREDGGAGRRALAAREGRARGVLPGASLDEGEQADCHAKSRRGDRRVAAAGGDERAGRSGAPAVRTTLNDYVRALHTPHGTLGMSPFASTVHWRRSVGRTTRAAAPDVRDPRHSPAPIHPALDDVTGETLERTVRELRELAAAASGAVILHSIPGAARRKRSTRRTTSRSCASCPPRSARSGGCRRQARRSPRRSVCRRCGMPRRRRRGSRRVGNQPVTWAPAAVLGNRAWNAAPSERCG
jgi:hypothetical protein